MVEDTPRTPAATLRPNAIGFVDALAIGLNATSPAYSLAAVIGPIVALVGVHAPGVMLASFVPMVLIASAFYHLNRADPDCGTTFSWVTRALGPTAGWLGGWAITMTGVLVVGSLADVAVNFGLLAVGLDGWAGNTLVRQSLTVLLIVAMAALCVRDTQGAARLQNVLVLLQTVCLFVFVAVALHKVLSGTGSPDAVRPAVGWLNPFGAGGTALTGGLLLGVFVYWGWESAVNLSEETTDPSSTPGRAGIWSTVVLLATYVSVAFAVVAFAGTGYLSAHADDEEAVFASLAHEVLGGWDWIVLLAVATSALASTQTTIIPASRTALSMARRHALPSRFGRIHGRFRTPAVSTWWVAGTATVWYLVIHRISENALADSLTALSLLIAFYYALTGIACAVYHRRRLTAGVREFLFIGAGPVIGAGMLVWLLVEAVADMADPANSAGGTSWFGLGPPLVIALGLSLVGIVVMLARRAVSGTFWDERPTAHEGPEAAEPSGEGGRGGGPGEPEPDADRVAAGSGGRSGQSR
ncbi:MULTISPECIES: APC family permease [unclassified Streptomyces]|uniref:APC family permease n=1 Tax=unclassified Streptomyces TaxID=2593676 RepID=UPI0029B8A5B3|nr:APC family permease [Streptomyces sp. DK15]MDX2389056.1 APC family permease [Streptomyces sp. DK15]